MKPTLNPRRLRNSVALAIASAFLAFAPLSPAFVNLWPNPQLELDSNGDGIPDFWNKAGTDPAFAIWDTNYFVSRSHSLAATDTSLTGYGQWYSDRFPVTQGERYILSFKRRYNTSEIMRFGVRYYSSSNTFLSQVVFAVTGFQPTWEQFVTQLIIPTGATKLDLDMVTGGRFESTGTNWIDDISLTSTQMVTLVSTGSVWKYLDNGSDQSTNWLTRSFNDSAWASGPAQLGYGDGDEATIDSYGPDATNKYVTTYFRYSFALQNASIFKGMIVNLIRDDGAVVYLNGAEVWRSNMPTNQAIAFDTLASSVVSGTDESRFYSFLAGAELLTNGLNVLAIEIHQFNRNNGTDMSFELELLGFVNFPPVASITNPTNSAFFAALGTISIDATASDSDGTVCKIELFHESTKVGEVTNGPYHFTWSNVPVGDYSLTAVATDDSGSRGTSAVVNVTVNNSTLYSLVSTGAVWKYLDDGSNQGTNWSRIEFNDSAWLSGPAQLGYGDGDEATVVGYGNDPVNKFVTTYFRRSFLVEDTSTFAGLILRLLRDDGAVVFLNNTEVFRSNMPTGAISHLTLAASAVGGNAPEENKFYVTPIQPSALRLGTNLIAVEIHQAIRESSDISFDLELGVSELTPAPMIFVNGRSDPMGAYTATNRAEIRLETTFPNGFLFYSLDGSTPSTLYAGPLTLRRTAAIRAIAYNSNFTESAASGPVTVTIRRGYVLLATTSGGGTLTFDRQGTHYLSNTVVEVTAVPDSGWTFLGWQQDASGTNPTVSIPMTRNRCVQAVFGTSIATSAVGNGSIVVNPQSSIYPYGVSVGLTALPQAGNYFAFWGNSASGTNNPLLFAVTNPNPTITAVFSTLTTGRFALTVIPDGNGTVNVNPPANFYSNGQTVMLTATPGTGQTFLGWSGNASGTQNPLVVVMTQSKLIAANFSRRPRLDVNLCFGQPGNEAVQVTLTGELGAAYQFEGSTNLTHWIPLATLTNVMGTVQYDDPSITNLHHRVYRGTIIAP